MLSFSAVYKYPKWLCSSSLGERWPSSLIIHPVGLGGFEGGWWGQSEPGKLWHSEGRTTEQGPVLKGWCNGGPGCLLGLGSLDALLLICCCSFVDCTAPCWPILCKCLPWVVIHSKVLHGGFEHVSLKHFFWPPWQDITGTPACSSL